MTKEDLLYDILTEVPPLKDNYRHSTKNVYESAIY